MHPAQNAAGSGRKESCRCEHGNEDSRMVVLTGGPGAGKTAVLGLVRQHLCRHVYVVEESASMLFGGGFPRCPDQAAERAAQRAIYHVQRELEFIARNRAETVLCVCDRGTLDGIAYWPGEGADFLAQVGTTLEAELSRYAAVIHLRPASPAFYNHEGNRLRIESAAEARKIDQRIDQVWAGHPRRFTIDSQDDFLVKARQALELVEQELKLACPRCCVVA